MKYKVYAPRSIANFGTGFDVLGGAIYGIGDVVEAERTKEFKDARLENIIGNNGRSLPTDSSNVVVAVANNLIKSVGFPDGIKLILYKNLPLNSGTGGSASSGAASAEATRLILGASGYSFPKDDKRMLDAVIHGEAVATNTEGHADNAFAALLGGFALVTDFKERKYQLLGTGNDFYFLLVTPQGVSVNTGDARRELDKALYHRKELVALSTGFMTGRYPQQMENHMKFNDVVKEGGDPEKVRKYLQGSLKLIEGIKKHDLGIFGEGTMMDEIVTPVRAQFIPGYERIEKAALDAGAYGFGISGSGPAMFALVDDIRSRDVGRAITDADTQSRISVKVERVKLDYGGARRVSC